MTLSVRPFEMKDIGDLATLMGELGYPTSTESMSKRMETIESLPDQRTFVADIDGRVVGMVGVAKRVAYEKDGVSVQIVALVAHSEYRGTGIGKSLVQEAEKWACEAGAATIFLTSGTRPERTRAHEFYKNIGYEITGYRFVKRIE